MSGTHRREARFIACTATMLLLASCAVAQEASDPETGRRNIILFIGDGLSAELVAEAGEASGGQLLFEEFPVAVSPFTGPPDPAAAATAIACGVATAPGHVGVDSEGIQVESILDLAQMRGWATGLVTSAQLTNCTVAAFRAHVPDQGMFKEIIEQMFRSPLVDVLFAGGIETGEMSQFDALGIAMAKGYRPIWFPDDLGLAEPGQSVYAIYDFNDDGHLSPPEPLRDGGREAPQLETRPEGRRVDPHLWQLAAAAVEILHQAPEGFLLVVEGGQIASDRSEVAVAETLELNRALEATIERLEIHGLLGRSLIVVTGIHASDAVGLWARGPGSENLRDVDNHIATNHALRDQFH